MRFILIAILFALSVNANASCKYEAKIRLGLVWHTVYISSETPLTRKQVISRLAQKYNFHDVGDIYKARSCEE